MNGGNLGILHKFLTLLLSHINPRNETPVPTGYEAGLVLASLVTVEKGKISGHAGYLVPLSPFY